MKRFMHPPPRFLFPMPSLSSQSFPCGSSPLISMFTRGSVLLVSCSLSSLSRAERWAHQAKTPPATVPNRQATVFFAAPEVPLVG